MEINWKYPGEWWVEFLDRRSKDIWRPDGVDKETFNSLCNECQDKLSLTAKESATTVYSIIFYIAIVAILVFAGIKFIG